MKCPKCTSEMNEEKHHQLETDHCPSCGGVFLDKGELEKVDRENLGALIDLSVGKENVESMDRKPAHCYCCSNPMTALKGADEIQFDWCDKCEGMFFDAGELAKYDLFQADE